MSFILFHKKTIEVLLKSNESYSSSLFFKYFDAIWENNEIQVVALLQYYLSSFR
jgi:hypothetical protein